MVERYQARSGFSPTGMAAALAINGGVLAALIFAVPGVMRDPPPDTLEVTSIPIPPPPIEPEPQPVERASQTPAVDPYLPPVPIPAPMDAPILRATPDLPPVAPPSGITPKTGVDTAVAGVAVATPTPAPVTTVAGIDPRYRSDFQPDYPSAERRAERDGVVTVRVRIDVDGRVSAVERISATSDAFFDATRRRALSKWRFRAATRDGVAVESWREMTVRFTMES